MSIHFPCKDLVHPSRNGCLGYIRNRFVQHEYNTWIFQLKICAFSLQKNYQKDPKGRNFIYRSEDPGIKNDHLISIASNLGKAQADFQMVSDAFDKNIKK